MFGGDIRLQNLFYYFFKRTMAMDSSHFASILYIFPSAFKNLFLFI